MALLLFYASNMVTGWRATVAAERLINREEKSSLWDSLKFLGAFFAAPFGNHFDDWSHHRKKKVWDHVRLFGPYISTSAAFMLFMTHLLWYGSGAWKTQEYLYPFMFGHYLASLAFHYFHLKSEMNSLFMERKDNELHFISD